MRRHRPERETVAPFDERHVARGARAGESLAVARPHPRTPAPPGTACQGPRRASSPWPDGWPSVSPTETRTQGEIIPSRRRRPGGSTAAPNRSTRDRPHPGPVPRRCRQRGRRAPAPKPSPRRAKHRTDRHQLWARGRAHPAVSLKSMHCEVRRSGSSARPAGRGARGAAARGRAAGAAQASPPPPTAGWPAHYRRCG